MNTIIFTHCGKLGDFIYSWPVAAWFHRHYGKKIHWVLPRSFGPFQKVTSLLMLQDFSAAVTLLDFPVRAFGCGGQPYRFDPETYKLTGEYRNLGMRNYPDKFVSEYIAEEHGLGWDPDWVLNIGNPCRDAGDSALYTEQGVFAGKTPQIDLKADILANVHRMAGAGERHCAFSAMAVILYFARIPFILYRTAKDGSVAHYFPDGGRYQLRTVAARKVLVWRDWAARIEERVITKWLLLEGNR